MNRLIAAIILIMLLPLMGAVGLMNKIRGRNAFFVQSRLGKNLIPFELYKFTSMNPENAHMGRFDKFIRITGLDELPQLVNIIKGEMSFVGPRPLLLSYQDTLSDKKLLQRAEVKPGITGWTQINGRNNLSWTEKLKADLYYVRNRSLLLDSKIIVLTLWKMAISPFTSFKGHYTSEPLSRSVLHEIR